MRPGDRFRTPHNSKSSGFWWYEELYGISVYCGLGKPLKIRWNALMAAHKRAMARKKNKKGDRS